MPTLEDPTVVDREQRFFGDPVDGIIPSPVPQRGQIEPEQEAQQMEPVDALDYFTSKPPVAVGVGEQELYRPQERSYWSSFARQFHDRQFSNLDDYVDFVRNLKDESGNMLRYDQIDNFVKKQTLDHMPPHIKREFDERQQLRQEETKEMAQAKRIERLNKVYRKQGFEIGPDGKTHKVKDPFEQQMDISASHLKLLESHMKNKPKPPTGEGADEANFERQLERWDQIAVLLQQRYQDSINTAQADAMGGGDEHPEGSIASDPNTGEQMIKRNGKWHRM